MTNKMTPWHVETNDGTGLYEIRGIDGSRIALVDRLDNALMIAKVDSLHSALLAHRECTRARVQGHGLTALQVNTLIETDKLLDECRARREG